MRVILLQEVENLGPKFDVKEVSDGYARNFLIPRKLAIIATSRALEELKIRKISEEKKMKKTIENIQELKDKLKGLEILVKVKANEAGHLFGAIDERIIAGELNKQGYGVKPENVILEEHIKQLGDYKVMIKFFDKVETKILLKVEAE